MADNNTHDGYGTYRDNYGTPYTTNDGKPPTVPQTVQVPDGYGGTTTGTWSGGTVVKHT